MKSFTPFKTLLLLGVFLCCYQSSKAQDIHWTQFHNSSVYLSPALTAVFNGDTRFVGHYRSQWNKVPVNYLTFTGAFDTKFFNPKLKNSLFGFGLIFNSDTAGDGKLGSNQIAINGAYTHQLATKHFLTLGVQGAFTQRGIDYNAFRFGSQYDGDIWNANLGTNENFLVDRSSFFDFSAGLNYHFQNPGKRSKLDLGFALHRINEPENTFFTDESSIIYRRLNLYGMGTIGIKERLDLLLMGMGQFQKTHMEVVPSIALRIHLDITPTQETALQFGVAYRFSKPHPDYITTTLEEDAIAPVLEFFHKRWHVGLSYDINLSGFQPQTRRYGGPEMVVRYTITKVRIGEFKICPIY